MDGAKRLNPSGFPMINRNMVVSGSILKDFLMLVPST